MTTKPKLLDSSELGTRKYWDHLYTTEINNHAANHQDIGTVWFQDSDAERRILDYLGRLAGDDEDEEAGGGGGARNNEFEQEEEEEQQEKEEKNCQQQQQQITLSKPHTSFLDLGCGNGSILLALRDAGWSGLLVGVDYSAHSISLARQIAASSRRRSPSPSAPSSASSSAPPSSDNDIQFVQWDILDGSAQSLSALLLASASPDTNNNTSTNTNDNDNGIQTWDVVLDKGTFDAISLSSANHETDENENEKNDRPRPCEIYKHRILPLLSPGGLFLITSCNWTEDELRAWFLDDDPSQQQQHQQHQQQKPGRLGHFQEVGRVQYPTFRFGGVEGQAISTLCFRKI